MKRDLQSRSDTDILQILIMLSVSILLASSLLFTKRIFGGDWPLHVLLVESQIEAIKAGFFPTLFSNFPKVGFFYPTGIFLGGNFYALLGYLGVFTGPFYSIVFCIVLLFFYLQIAWRGITRHISGDRSNSILPGIVFVSSAYFLGDLFGRGGISSVFAISGIPIMAYSWLESIKNPRKLRHKFGILIGTIFIFSTHNISTLWIVSHFLFLAIIFSSILLVSKLNLKNGVRQFVIRSRKNFILFFASILITFWAMVPNLYFALRSDIAQNAYIQKDWSRNFNDPNNLFSLIRRIPPEHYGTDLFVQFPTLIFISALLYLIVQTFRNQITGIRLIALLLSLISIAFTLLMIYWLEAYAYLPKMFMSTQFTFRLNHFLYLAVTILVCIAVSIESKNIRAEPGFRRGLVFSLLSTFVAISLLQGISQSFFSNQDSPGERSNRSIEYWSNFWYSENELRLKDELPDQPLSPDVIFPEASFNNGRLDFSVTSRFVVVPTQGPVSLLDFCGGKPIGRDGKLLILDYKNFPTKGCVVSQKSPLTSTGIFLSVVGVTIFICQIFSIRIWRVRQSKKSRQQ